ncbi:pacearchaeosortase [Candidatus Pacearchaeota archaeon]|nr:pacearchaeosortase [Candidatus Pacearchaeota archaeon]
MREEYDYLLRYGLILVIGIYALAPLYWFLTPLTVFGTYLALSLVSHTTLLAETSLVFKGEYIALVPACIAGAAYYLLLICACTIPISWKERGKLIATSFGIFFLVNLLRILLATYLATSNQSLFDATHALFWYAGSTLIVIACWFGTATYYDIKEIPILTDIQNLIKAMQSKQ